MSIYTLTEPASLKDNIWLLLHVRRGSFWQRPSMGSRFHELRTAPAIDRTATRAVAMANEALGVLVAQGRARNVSASAGFVDGRLHLNVIVIDSTGHAVEFSRFIPVGVLP